ncbi:hypothetical protein ACFQV2_19095 [Actinokineospora soli]|uniref:Core-binding (CB) domain-containing protein n=1 Tax=Actinokineospora soli TaxID=1048753 RepID=A0ABW2TNL5_9PSEU
MVRLGGVDPVAARSAHVKAWLAALSEAGAAVATRDRMLATVKALYTHLADSGLAAGTRRRWTGAGWVWRCRWTAPAAPSPSPPRRSAPSTTPPPRRGGARGRSTRRGRGRWSRCSPWGCASGRSAASTAATCT